LALTSRAAEQPFCKVLLHGTMPLHLDFTIIRSPHLASKKSTGEDIKMVSCSIQGRSGITTPFVIIEEF
jgi:hypothetical protein